MTDLKAKLVHTFHSAAYDDVLEEVIISKTDHILVRLPEVTVESISYDKKSLLHLCYNLLDENHKPNSESGLSQYYTLLYITKNPNCSS